jgi:hypothetical protein
MGDQYHRPANRPLNAEEAALLRWLIAHGTSEAPRYADQIDRVRVVSECTCGCPTIDLALDDQPRATEGGSQIISDVVGKTPEGVGAGVILHVRGGALSELEVYAHGAETPSTLPRPEDLKAWEDAAV